MPLFHSWAFDLFCSGSQVYANQFSGETPKGCIKVLSYNTWNFGAQTEDAEGTNICIAYLQEQDADIVCLQEACPTARNIEQIDSMLKPMYAFRIQRCT